MSSSYSLGTRIAIDYAVEEIQTGDLTERLRKITKECGDDVSISSHFIETDAADWKSVYKKDKFFKDVKLIEDINEFILLINEDRLLKGIDVAKYILCKIKCTHLKLEKLTYLCFAEYLCQTGKELFEDSIYAFQYGPVVETVYNKYKAYGADLIKEISEEEYEKQVVKEKELKCNSNSEMPAKSRILFAVDGINKIQIIDDTLNKYGSLTSSELVSVTHKSSSPWEKEYTGEPYKVISKEIIKKYHKIEN
jgi:uncharacterized phage-associated protein